MACALNIINDRARPRLVIPDFRNLFFGQKMFLPGFLRIPFFFLCFLVEFLIGIWFWRGCRISSFFPVGQEFLYLPQNHPDSGGFQRIPVLTKSCWLWPATKEGSLLSKIWTKIDFFNLSPKQDLTMVSAAPVICWRLLA